MRNVGNLTLVLLGEDAGLCGIEGGGLAGLGGCDVLEPPGDGELEPALLTARPLGTMTHSSESLDGDVSLLDLKVIAQNNVN